MGRMIINKHFDFKSQAEEYLALNELHPGEFVICNEKGNEGVYIINTNREPFFISTNKGGGNSDIPEDFQEMLEELLKKYYTKQEVDDKFLALELEEMLNNVSASMSCSPGGIFEKGTTVSHIVTLRTNDFTLSDKSVLKSTIYKNNTVVAESTGDTVSYSDTITTSTSYSGTVTYKDGVKSWNANCSRSAYHRTYYGFASDVDSVFTKGNNKLTTSAKGTYTDTSTEDNSYYFIIVPSGVTAPSTFTMNATPFVMNKSSLTKNNISYTVFKSGSAFGIGGEVNINAQ